MKITMITCPFGVLPPGGIGAVERVWHQIGIDLATRGHTVEFIAKKDMSGRDSDGLPPGITIQPIDGFRRTGRLWGDLLLDFIFSLRALRRIRRSDVVVFNTFWSPALSFLFRSRFGSSVYNVQRVPKWQLWMYRKVDMLTTVSRVVESEILRQEPGATGRTRTIPNPIDFGVFSSHGVMPTARGVTEIVYSGRIHPEKGLHLLVKAAACLRLKGYAVAIKFVGPVVTEEGGGGEAYRDRLVHLAAGVTLVFAGGISDRLKLAREIASGDIYCYPSVAERGETFGVAPLEAMATGIPVVVSALECFHEFAEHGVNALVFDHRGDGVADLAEKLELLIGNAEMRARLGAAGKARASAFSVKRVADEYEKLFMDLTASKQSTGKAFE
jgi:glycosyltransferase involved in cell wall biosynthesis